MSKRLRTPYIAAVIVILAIALALIPVKYPYNISACGKTYPAGKWMLIRNTNGQLVSSMYNYRSGMSSGYDLASFSGSSNMQFNINPVLSERLTIEKGDTLGWIYSSEIVEEIIKLTGELEIARANLAVYTSGENLPEIEELEQELDYVREEIISQNTILNRQKSLLEADLITLEDYEIEESRASLLKIKQEIAQTRLKAAKTGEKPELVELMKSQIRSLENQIHTLQNRQNSYVITSPIDGNISKFNSTDTILTVFDIDSLVVVFPIESRELKFVEETENPAIMWDLDLKSRAGYILNLDDQVRMLDNHSVVYASALFERNSENILPGMFCRCKIKCDDVGLFELARRNLESLLR